MGAMTVAQTFNSLLVKLFCVHSLLLSDVVKDASDTASGVISASCSCGFMHYAAVPIHICLGLFLCFAGYRFYRFVLPFIGASVGVCCATLLKRWLSDTMNDVVFCLLILVLAIAGAATSCYMHNAGLALLGGELGLLASNMVINVLHIWPVWNGYLSICIELLSILGGAYLAFKMFKPSMILATSVLGSISIITAVDYAFGVSYTKELIGINLSSVESILENTKLQIASALFLVFAVTGTVFQLLRERRQRKH